MLSSLNRLIKRLITLQRIYWYFNLGSPWYIKELPLLIL